MDSERVEEYLEAIYKRQRTEIPVSTSAIAKDLRISLPAVTDMLRRLESEGLIDYQVSKGALLTTQGEERAVFVIRRHRLWERFLTDILGMKWEKVHPEACRLEHATSPETEKRLASLLGDVDTCPHGNPIPDGNGNIKEQEGTPLSESAPGQTVLVVTVTEETPELLKRIGQLGLKPGAVVTVEKENDDGSLELELGKERRRLKKEIAAVLLVKPVPTSEKVATLEEIPISKLGTGESGIVKAYAGGRAMLGRCLSLGFTPGSLVKMLKNFGSGPVLVRLHDTEVALGRAVAEKISVTRSGTAC